MRLEIILSHRNASSKLMSCELLLALVLVLALVLWPLNDRHLLQKWSLDKLDSIRFKGFSAISDKLQLFLCNQTLLLFRRLKQDCWHSSEIAIVRIDVLVSGQWINFIVSGFQSNKKKQTCAKDQNAIFLLTSCLAAFAPKQNGLACLFRQTVSLPN